MLAYDGSRTNQGEFFLDCTSDSQTDFARWSFGSNRLQIKAESRLLADVDSALRAVASIGARGIGPLMPLSQRQDLLHLLLENEQVRLVVWLYPLDHERRHIFSAGHAGKTQEVCMRPLMVKHIDTLQSHLLALLNTAWAEDASLAVQLVTRFQSLRLTNDVRRLLLMYPEKALAEPDALQIILGPSLPSDVNSQLKVWYSTIEYTTLTMAVSSVLGAGEPDHCSHLFPTRLRQPSIYTSIRHARSGKSFGGCDFLLCSSNSASSTIRCSWLCAEVHH